MSSGPSYSRKENGCARNAWSTTWERPHLTARDLHANTLEDLFDFEHAPSLDALVVVAPPPLSTDPGCQP